MSRRAGEPPVDRNDVFRLLIFRVEPGSSAIIRTLTEAYSGCFTHFAKGRSWYCPGDDGSCQLHKAEKIWKGYAPAELYDQAGNRWAPTVLEISEHLELDFRGRYDRGQVWELSRAVPGKKHKATPVVGRLLEERDPSTFPPPFSIQEVLRTRYHVPLVVLDKKNPLPPRVFVTYSQGEAPKCLGPSADDKPTDPEAVARFREELRKRTLGVNGNGKHA